MILSCIVALSLSAMPPAADGLALGTPAPEIGVSDWLNSRPISLGGELGRVIVLEFWATW